MYFRIFEGKKIRVSNYHYKLLLKRFNKSEFKPKKGPHLSEDILMRNDTPCSLCKAHFKRQRRRISNCGKCPLRIFEYKSVSFYLGCGYVLNKLAPTNYVNTFVGYTSYWSRNKRMALKELKIITKFLKSFKKE